ncbi:MAG: ATP-binding cassette domain-containing protein, partial [Verrucomicrobiota bacterium]
ARRAFRIAHIGMIFQEFELLDYLKVRDNMLLPFRVNPALTCTREVRDRIDGLAESVKVGGLMNRYPRRLSQGERQRVAICRALATEPGLIFADEPTGNLDPKTSDTIVDIILEQAKERDATVLMVTHDHSLLKRFDRVVDLDAFLEDGS